MNHQMQPGHELDLLVAEKAMGIGTEWVGGLPAYSTDDAVAVKHIAPRLREQGWLVILKWMPKEFPFIIPGARSEYDAPHDDTELWHGKVVVELEYMRRYEERDLLWVRSPLVVADTIAHALSLAALEAQKVLEEARKRKGALL